MYEIQINAVVNQTWEKFINNDAIAISELLRIAIAHYQFETIHPFLMETEELVDYSLRCNWLAKKRGNGEKLLNELFKNPVITSQQVKEKIGVALPTANSLIKDFQELGILEELTGYKRNRIFYFTEYIDIFL